MSKRRLTHLKNEIEPSDYPSLLISGWGKSIARLSPLKNGNFPAKISQFGTPHAQRNAIEKPYFSQVNIANKSLFSEPDQAFLTGNCQL
ncbi:MAG: hypothetical protein O2948_02235 [Proteobacteria bacterium]|nr:hypothetical protein [Pseudomonadota bacterium]MDA0928158.1 hypothetical protein [Pseudomonadota bacterium]